MQVSPPVRILVTNDDGIDSVGLHHLVTAMAEHGEVTVIAPDREFSGAGAAIGSLWDFEPVVTRREVADAAAAWTVNGPPALCVMYAGMNLFSDKPFDLVVSGINPGANVGRSVYHSGTIGACLTARHGGVSSLAVSQMFAVSYEGQAIAEMVADQVWDTAAHAASEFVGAAIETGLPAQPFVANLNVPNEPLEGIKGIRRSPVGVMPPSAMTKAALVPTEQIEVFGIEVNWGSGGRHHEPNTDVADVSDGYITLSYLSRIIDEPVDDLVPVTAHLESVYGGAG